MIFQESCTEVTMSKQNKAATNQKATRPALYGHTSERVSPLPSKHWEGLVQGRTGCRVLNFGQFNGIM